MTRQWFEQARKAGQVLGSDASGATFAAGVKHVTDLLPALMQDIIAVAPEDQKVRSLEVLLKSYSPLRIHNECGRENSAYIMICSCVDSCGERLRNIIFRILLCCISKLTYSSRLRSRLKSSSTSGSVATPSQPKCLINSRIG